MATHSSVCGDHSARAFSHLGLMIIINCRNCLVHDDPAQPDPDTSPSRWGDTVPPARLTSITVYGVNSRFTQQCNVVFYVYADLCSLLAATSQFSILIGQKMQLTGCHNDNEMGSAVCVDTKISIEWPYYSFLYCASIIRRLLK